MKCQARVRGTAFGMPLEEKTFAAGLMKEGIDANKADRLEDIGNRNVA